MPDLKINIKTTSDLKAVKDSNQAIKDSAKVASDANREFEKMAAVTAAAATAIAAATKAIKEFAGTQEAVFKLDAALAQHGALVEHTRQNYQALAGELQNTTGIADDQWLDVLTRLTQFGSRPETIGIDVEAVKNLAGIMGGNLQGAALAYTRALQGQFEMFGRLGIRVDENLSQFEKLNQLQIQLAQVGGGQLEARATSLNGQWAVMKNAINDVFKGFGNLLSQTGLLQVGMNLVTGAARGLTRLLPTVTEQSDSLTNKMNAAAQAAQDEAKGLKAVNDQLKTRNENLAESRRIADQQSDAQQAFELAQIDLAESTGLAPEQANLQRAEIRRRFANAKLNAQAVEARQKVQDLQAVRSGAIDAARAANQSASAAQSNFESLAANAGLAADVPTLSNLFRSQQLAANRLDQPAIRAIDNPIINNPYVETYGGAIIPGLRSLYAYRDYLRAKRGPGGNAIRADAFKTGSVLRAGLNASSAAARASEIGGAAASIINETANPLAAAQANLSASTTGLATSGISFQAQTNQINNQAAEARAKEAEARLAKLQSSMDRLSSAIISFTGGASDKLDEATQETLRAMNRLKVSREQ